MKKTLWMLGVAVAALTSCIKSEVLDTEGIKNIDFEIFVNKETRTTISSTDDLTKFYVYGYNTSNQNSPNYATATYTELFNGSELIGPGWTHSIPSESAAWANHRRYRFAAYTNGNASVSNVSYDPQKQILTFLDYVSTDVDLVADIPNDVDTDENVATQPKVPLNFIHMLSRVRFTFINQSLTNQIRVDNIEFDIYNKATGTLQRKDGKITPSWDPTGNPKENITYEIGTLDISGNNNATIQKEHYIIPQENDIEITVTYHTLAADGNVLNTNGQNGSGETVHLNISDGKVPGQIKWEPGYVYNYTAKLNSSTKKIEFYVETISNWNNVVPSMDDALQ